MTYRYVTRDETIYYYNVCVHVVRVPVCNRDCIRQIFPPDVPAPQLRYSRLCKKYWFPDMNYWEEQIEAKLNDSLFPREMAVSYWVAMQSAREFVHRQGMPLRAQARIEVIEQLDLLEAASPSHTICGCCQTSTMK